MAADLSGIAQSSEPAMLSPLVVSLINSHHITLEKGKVAAEREAQSERLNAKDLRDRLATAETGREVLRERLEGIQSASKQTVVLSGIGGAAFGFVPYAYDKTNTIGALVMGLIGIALLWA